MAQYHLTADSSKYIVFHCIVKVSVYITIKQYIQTFQTHPHIIRSIYYIHYTFIYIIHP